MRRWCRWAAPLLLVGCLKYDEGRAEEGELACRLREVCNTLETVGYDDVESCITSATGQDWGDCPDYSAERLLDCLDAWEAAVETKNCALSEDPPDVCAQVCGA
ncbi:hypothetical protein LBMAG42_37580 [Deltaproteobacteria bacterium]|nr:hypothetical protein LBMAG42_37580 [Deltaproteobacteria bacterium]